MSDDRERLWANFRQLTYDEKVEWLINSASFDFRAEQLRLQRQLAGLGLPAPERVYVPQETSGAAMPLPRASVVAGVKRPARRRMSEVDRTCLLIMATACAIFLGPLAMLLAFARTGS